MSDYNNGVVLPNLREWRMSRGLTQLRLAIDADVAQTTVARLEQGAKARPGTVGKLAKVLGITGDQLMTPVEEVRR